MGDAVRVWGWSYRTLQGHLEMGQMDYALWKWLDDGVGRIPHPRRVAAGSHPQSGRPAGLPAIRELTTT